MFITKKKTISFLFWIIKWKVANNHISRLSLIPLLLLFYIFVCIDLSSLSFSLFQSFLLSRLVRPHVTFFAHILKCEFSHRLPNCLPACVPTYPPSLPPTYVPKQPPNRPAHLPTYRSLPPYLPTFNFVYTLQKFAVLEVHLF